MDKKKQLKIVVTAGGGGHFSPALAVMKKLHGKADILYIGRKYAFEGDKTISFEYQTVSELQIPFRTITTGRLQRVFSLQAVLSLCKIPVGFVSALRILSSEKPDVVLSFGGYIAVPVTLAAHALGIPVVVHEQTMGAGLANKISGIFAAKICLTFPSSETFFPTGKTIVTGSPLRESMLHPEKRSYFREKKQLIFITGGSLGSHAINVLVEGILEHVLEKYLLIHQIGDAKQYNDFDRLVMRREALPEEMQKRYLPLKFVKEHEMAGIESQADLIIGRSGINTVSEILFFQKPALLIPLPYGQKGEQLQNATFLASLGLAKVKHQEALTPETLYTEIEEMMAELSQYRLKEAVPYLINHHATEEIIAVIFSVAKNVPQETETAEKAT